MLCCNKVVSCALHASSLTLQYTCISGWIFRATRAEPNCGVIMEEEVHGRNVIQLVSVVYCNVLFMSYQVVKRPFLLIYNNNRDPVSLSLHFIHDMQSVFKFTCFLQVERDFINLANAKVQYNAEHSKAHGVSEILQVLSVVPFTISYMHTYCKYAV